MNRLSLNEFAAILDKCGYETSEIEVPKPEGMTKGLGVKMDENITCVLYQDMLNDLCDHSESEMDLLNEVTKIFNKDVALKELGSEYANKDFVLKNVIPVLYGGDYAEKLAENMLNVPFIHDTKVFFRVVINANGFNYKSFLVGKRLGEHLGLDGKELLEIAVKNNTPVFTNLNDYLAKITGMLVPDDIFPVKTYFITNKNQVYGAATILNTEKMQEIHDMVGDFYILPSSVHECIIVPDGAHTSEDLLDMVRTINGDPSVMNPRDILTDDVWYFNGFAVTAA